MEIESKPTDPEEPRNSALERRVASHEFRSSARYEEEITPGRWALTSITFIYVCILSILHASTYLYTLFVEDYDCALYKQGAKYTLAI